MSSSCSAGTTIIDNGILPIPKRPLAYRNLQYAANCHSWLPDSILRPTLGESALVANPHPPPCRAAARNRRSLGTSRPMSFCSATILVLWCDRFRAALGTGISCATGLTGEALRREHAIGLRMRRGGAGAVRVFFIEERCCDQTVKDATWK